MKKYDRKFPKVLRLSLLQNFWSFEEFLAYVFLDLVRRIILLSNIDLMRVITTNHDFCHYVCTMHIRTKRYVVCCLKLFVNLMCCFVVSGESR